MTKTDGRALARTLYGIFGTGGFGREGMALAQESCLTQHDSVSDFDLCFVQHQVEQSSVDGHPVLSLERFASLDRTERRVSILIADTGLRSRIAAECDALGLRPFTIRSRLAEIHPTAQVGDGAVLCQFTLVSANARIGRHFHLNHHGYVSHDCTIGDCVTFAPSVRCNGTIEIGDRAYIGSGAMIRQGTPDRAMRIGVEATVGMGAVVLDPVEDGSTVVGNPARVLSPGY